MIDTADLYELPWTKHDNPNGWLEPTTYCQLKCPFCYRGADREGFRPVHMRVRDVKDEIDGLVSARRVASLTIAGGEPLLYPHLDEIIDYIRDRGVEVMILSNGDLLDEPRLVELRDRGVARIVIHIDKHQKRKGIETEDQANRIRRAHCELFRKVGGISLGFAQPVGPDDLDDLEVLIEFFKENADVIDLVNFNRMEPSLSRESTESRVLDAATLFERVREVYGLQYCGHLKKTRSDEISWLLGQAVFSGSRLLGSLDKNAFRFIQTHYYGKNRRSGIKAAPHAYRTPRFLTYMPFNRSLREMLFKYLGQTGARGTRGRIHLQLVLVINAPTKKNGEWDTCRGCPDAMFYRGKLVPSCLLERIKSGEFVEAG